MLSARLIVAFLDISSRIVGSIDRVAVQRAAPNRDLKKPWKEWTS
jgi:hypothetical protein